MPQAPRRIIGVAVLALVGASFAMGNPVKAAPSATMRCPLPQELLVACLQQNFDQSVHEERFNAETAGFTTPIKWGQQPHWHDVYPVGEISPDHTADLNADGRPDVIQ